MRLRGARAKSKVNPSGTPPCERTPIELPEPALIAAALANVTRCGMRPWGTHGLAHWWRVRHNGLSIARAMGANPSVVRLFAIFHDSHRHDDGHDPDHGPRAAEWLREVRLSRDSAYGACALTRATIIGLTETDFESLCTACALHTSAIHHVDASVAACFVADRLDLSRVGYRPDPNRMPAPRHVIDEQAINAAIDRERRGLEWIGGREIEQVWGVSVPKRS